MTRRTIEVDRTDVLCAVGFAQLWNANSDHPLQMNINPGHVGVYVITNHESRLFLTPQQARSFAGDLNRLADRVEETMPELIWPATDEVDPSSAKED